MLSTIHRRHRPHLWVAVMVSRPHQQTRRQSKDIWNGSHLRKEQDDDGQKKLFNNAAGKPDWRCFSSSTVASSPSAPDVCQDQQAADVARGRSTTTALTSPPAGHNTGRRRSSRELDQTGIVCLSPEIVVADAVDCFQSRLHSLLEQ